MKISIVAILIGFFSLVFSGVVYAATWTEASSPAGGSNRNWISLAVNFVGSETALAGVDGGRLYRYTSSGWAETQPAGDVNGVWRLVAAGGNYMVAGNDGGRLYLSEDSGASWTEIQPAGDVNENWSTGLINSFGSRILVAARGGRVYQSTNGGDSWSEVQPAGDNDRDWQNMSWSNTSSTMMICASGVGGRVYRSTNFGSNWSEVQPGGDADFDWGTCQVNSGADLYVAAVTGGRAYKSTDASSWSEITPAGNTDQSWHSAKIGTSNNILIAASSGRIYYSTDSGDNWSQEQPAGDTNGDWRAVAMSGNGATMYAAANGGRLYSTNGASSSPSPSVSNNSSTPLSVPSGEGVSAPSCTAGAPAKAPELFQLDAAGTYANVYFKTVTGGTGYRINYGLTADANEHSDSFDYTGNAWTLGRTINALTANSTYYFKVQAVNGCNAGPWSETKQASTRAAWRNVTAWFANLNPFKSIPASTIVTTASSAKSPIPAAAQSSAEPKVAGAAMSNRLTPAECIYTFKSGDSLWSIAQTQLGRWEYKEDILALNPGLDPTKLFNGNKIKLCE